MTARSSKDRLPHLPHLPTWTIRKPCAVRTCRGVAKCLSPYCAAHRNRLKRHGHVEQRPVHPYILRRAERRVRYFLSRIQHPAREHLERIAAERVSMLMGYAAAVASRERPARTMHERRAAEQFAKLKEVEPMRIMVRLTALHILFMEQPGLFNSDEAYRTQCVRLLRRLNPIPDRIGWSITKLAPQRVWKDLGRNTMIQLGAWLTDLSAGYAPRLYYSILRADNLKAVEQAALDAVCEGIQSELERKIARTAAFRAMREAQRVPRHRTEKAKAAAAASVSD